VACLLHTAPCMTCCDHRQRCRRTGDGDHHWNRRSCDASRLLLTQQETTERCSTSNCWQCQYCAAVLRELKELHAKTTVNEQQMVWTVHSELIGNG
jgi:hypothetical protein